jgi:hypothetical protein
MEKLSRRSLVAGAAALPTLGVPAIAIYHPDAELLRLALPLREIEQQRAAQMAIDREEDAAREAICERAGLPWRDIYDFVSDEERHEYQSRRSELIQSSAVPYDDEEDENGATRWDRITKRLWPTVEKILSLKAVTVAGFALQVRAFLLMSCLILSE